MKLYLSSYRVPTPQKLSDLIGKSPENCKVVILPNAKDYYSDRVRNIKATEILQYFLELGYQPEVVDLLEYSSPDKLEKRLKDFDLIWGNGGNTFCLRYEMNRSGFDDIIHDLLKRGIVYGGESAGAIVAGNSLKDIDLSDEPEYSEGVILEGLNLIDKFVLPHIDNPFFNEANEITIERRKDDSNIIKLTDSQALVVKDEKLSIVGKAT